jgi:hypothetical protein
MSNIRIAIRWLYTERTNVWYDSYELTYDNRVLRTRTDCGKMAPSLLLGSISNIRPDASRSQNVFYASCVYYCPTCCEFWGNFENESEHTKSFSRMFSVTTNRTWEHATPAQIIAFEMMALVLRHKHPALIKRKETPSGVKWVGEIRWYDDYEHVGPWLINRKDVKSLELKKWLHGQKSVHDSEKEIIKKSVVKRAVKYGLTGSEMAFFQTMFGAAKLSRWIQQKKQEQDEHTNNKLQAAS